jgi:hypothetical protein
MAVEIFWLPGTLNLVFWLANGLLAWKALTGFIAIRRKM